MNPSRRFVTGLVVTTLFVSTVAGPLGVGLPASAGGPATTASVAPVDAYWRAGPDSVRVGPPTGHLGIMHGASDSNAGPALRSGRHVDSSDVGQRDRTDTASATSASSVTLTEEFNVSDAGSYHEVAYDNTTDVVFAADGGNDQVDLFHASNGTKKTSLSVIGVRALALADGGEHGKLYVGNSNGHLKSYWTANLSQRWDSNVAGGTFDDISVNVSSGAICALEKADTDIVCLDDNGDSITGTNFQTTTTGDKDVEFHLRHNTFWVPNGNGIWYETNGTKKTDFTHLNGSKVATVGDFGYVYNGTLVKADVDENIQDSEVIDLTVSDSGAIEGFNRADRIYMGGGSGGMAIVGNNLTEFFNDTAVPNGQTIRGIDISHTETYRKLFVTTSGGNLYKFDTGVLLDATVSGTVVDQFGDPVANATVQVVGVDHSNIQLKDADTTRERGKELLEQAANATPPQWAGGPTLLGPGGVFETASTKPAGSNNYVAIHTEDQWGFIGGRLRPELNTRTSSPKTVVPSNVPLILSVWDPDRGGIQDGVDRQLPGATVDDATITIDQVAHTGEVIHRRRLTTDERSRGFGTAGDHFFASVSLPQGFYVVSTTQSQISYAIAVGNPDDIENHISTNLRDRGNDLIEQAETIQNRFDRNKFTRETVESGSDGTFSVGIGTTTNQVKVQAWKMGGRAVIADPANTTYVDGLDEYEAYLAAGGEPATVYLTEGGKVHQVPATNITVETRAVDCLSFQDLVQCQNATNTTETVLGEDGFEDVPIPIDGPTVDQALAYLRDIYRELRALVEANPVVEERYRNLTDQPTIRDAEDLNKEQLRTEIDLMGQALYSIASSGEVVTDPGEFTNGTTTITRAWIVDEIDLEAANVSVLARWSNGTTTTVPERYIVVDDRFGRDDEVRVEEFPIGDEDPAQVTLALRIAGPDNVVRHNLPVRNPTLTGATPDIDAIHVSSLRPTSDANVTVHVRPGPDSTFQRLTGATVFTPAGGKPAVANVSDMERQFTLNATGVHVVSLTFVDTNGNQWTERFRLKAVETRGSRPPSIQVRSGIVGTYVLVADGFTDGEVVVEDEGRRIRVAGVLDGEADVPRSVHVYTSDFLSARRMTVHFSLLRGADETQVRERAFLVVHGRALSEDGLVWREQNQPISEDGTQWGVLDRNAGNVSVRTWVGSAGRTRVQLVENPGSLETVNHWVRANVFELDLGIDIPFVYVGVGVRGGGPALAVALLVVGWRWRWWR